MTNPATTAFCEMRPPLRLGRLCRSRPGTGWPGSWFPESDVHFTYGGRTALRRLCDILGLAGADVLVPAYNCGAETEPIVDGGARIVPYRVDEKASIDLEDMGRLISERTKAIHVTHYFGFPQPIDEIKAVCERKGLFLIEDCALALFSGFRGRKLGSWGDAAVFSLPKTLPLPDGGALVINNPSLRLTSWQKRHVPFLRTARGAASLSASAFLRRLSMSDALHGIYLSLYTRRMAKEPPFLTNGGGAGLPDVPYWMHYTEDRRDRALSRFSQYVLRGVDEGEIVRIRRRNYTHLASRLPEAPDLRPLYGALPDDVCPLGLPLVCADRERLYRALLTVGVASAIWWPGFPRNMEWASFPEARFLKEHVLLLPVHQGLREEDMENIARFVAESRG